MNGLTDFPFPSTLPAPTAFYLALYLGTLVLHFAFMHYVFAGTAFVAWRALFAEDPDGSEVSSYDIARDWLPVMLSGAITAGIAPLLFLQILYKQSFYTANLLLFHRWMAILPVLIVGFYALYLQKWKGSGRLPQWLFRTISVVPFAAMLFTAYTWTINHQLSLRSASEWSEFYATETAPFSFAGSSLRLIFWFALSFPTFALTIAWQLRHQARLGKPLAPQSVRLLALLALTGLAASTLLGAAYLLTTPGGHITAFSRSYLALALIGFSVQALAWIAQLRSERLSGALLLASSIAVFCSLCGIAVAREDLRLQTIDPAELTQLFAAHAKAASIGGMGAFLVSLLLNCSLIVFCFIAVRRNRS